MKFRHNGHTTSLKAISAWNGLVFAEAPSWAVFRSNFILNSRASFPHNTLVGSCGILKQKYNNYRTDKYSKVKVVLGFRSKLHSLIVTAFLTTLFSRNCLLRTLNKNCFWIVYSKLLLAYPFFVISNYIIYTYLLLFKYIMILLFHFLTDKSLFVWLPGWDNNNWWRPLSVNWCPTVNHLDPLCDIDKDVSASKLINFAGDTILCLWCRRCN